MYVDENVINRKDSDFSSILLSSKDFWNWMQCSQNVDVNGPHHRCLELNVSSSFNKPMAVERGRSHELVGSMVGAVYVHVLRTLTGWYLEAVRRKILRVIHRFLVILTIKKENINARRNQSYYFLSFF